MTSDTTRPPVRIATWNLNHRASEKKTLPTLPDAVAAVDADVWVFTEFVDGPSRQELHARMASMGYSSSLITRKERRQNQVWVASRFELEPGQIPPPDFTLAASVNFLHCSVPALGIEVVGVRAPAYEKVAERRSYWQQLASRISENSHRPVAFIGDLNCDPADNRFPGTKVLNEHDLSGYQVPAPEGEWSFISMDGSKRSRIDHAIVSSKLAVRFARYLHEIGGHTLAGPKELAPISDHAILLVEIEAPGSLVGRSEKRVL